MKRLVVYLERDDIHGMVLDRTPGGFVLHDYISDPAKLADYMRSTKAEPIVCADVYASVRSMKTKETVASRKAAAELLAEKKVLPGEDVWWDFAQMKGWLNVFSVKKTALTKLWEIHGDFSLEEKEVVLKPAALYDYAVAALDGAAGDFSVLNLSASLFNYLIVAGGRVFYMEIPGISMDDVVDEIKRSIEYLQVQEGVRSEVFQRMYAVIENEELRAKLADRIKRELVPLPEKVAGADRLAGRKGYLPLAVGALIAQTSRRGGATVPLAVNTQPPGALLKKQAIALWQRHGFAALCAVSLVCAVADAAIVMKTAAMDSFVAANRARTETEIPAYLAAARENAALRAVEAAVMPTVRGHTDIAESLGTVAELLGPVRVTGFEYRRAEGRYVFELESASYDAVSVFLKKARESGRFSAVTPLSSETAKDGGKESVRFKVEMVR